MSEEIQATSNNLSQRYSYLLECSRASHEQIIHHTTHRESVLKYQLVAQIAILSLSLGFTFNGIQPPAGIKHFDLLLLSFPISAIFSALYVIEDRLVSHFCEYFGSLSEKERILAESSDQNKIENSEVSPQLRAFSKTTLPFRLFAQAGAFLLIPVVLTTYRWTQPNISIHWPEWLGNAVLFSGISGMLIWAFLFHRGTTARAAIDSETV